MTKISSQTIHHFFKGILLLGFSFYIFLLTFTGEILQFVVPQLVIYIQIAAGFLFIVTAFQFYIAFLSIKKTVILCECDHDHGHDDNVLGHEHHHILKSSIGKDVFIYSLFLLPLILGFLLPNQANAGSLATNRGMNFGGINGPHPGTGAAVELSGNIDPKLKQMFKTTVYDQDYAKLGIVLYQQDTIEMKDKWFIEKLQSMNNFVDNFQDKKIKIKGFIYREDGLGGNQFIIARMGMTHCIADISPYGIITETDNPSMFPDNSWVTITGTIGKTNYKGQDVLKIKVESAEPASAPSNPYVYPDWKFGKKL